MRWPLFFFNTIEFILIHQKKIGSGSKRNTIFFCNASWKYEKKRSKWALYHWGVKMNTKKKHNNTKSLHSIDLVNSNEKSNKKSFFMCIFMKIANCYVIHLLEYCPFLPVTAHKNDVLRIKKIPLKKKWLRQIFYRIRKSSSPVAMFNTRNATRYKIQMECIQ